MTIEELEKQVRDLQEQNKTLADAKGGGMDDEQRKRLNFLEADHKTLIAARDKAKEEARKAEEEKLLENEECKTLA